MKILHMLMRDLAEKRLNKNLSLSTKNDRIWSKDKNYSPEMNQNLAGNVRQYLCGLVIELLTELK